MRIRILLPVLFISCLSMAQSRIDRAVSSDLFQKEDIIEVTLKMNIEAVVKDIEDRHSHYAEMTYMENGQKSEVIPLEVKTRGKTRANPEVCSFPPLRLNFKKKGNYDNLFAGQDKLKLVTHCQKKEMYDDYILQEYLTYKHYNILTDNSFKVRLLKVTYVDSAGTEETIHRYGFFIEDEEVMAKRNDMAVREGTVPNQEFCERQSLNIMTMFQYMIGNTDWSVPNLHNMKLISKTPTSNQPIPVPYDFDYSGAIATNYAEPDVSLGIASVRYRVFRGFCRSEIQYEPVFELFNDKKKEIYALYSNSELLSDKDKQITLKYFDKFYDTINKSKKARNEFNRSCRINHVHVDW